MPARTGNRGGTLVCRWNAATAEPSIPAAMPLTDAQVRAAKPRDGKLTKFSDGAGLQLWAHPSGKRSWHVAFRIGGRQQSVTLGHYPAVSLKEARELARKTRRKRVETAPSAPQSVTFGAVKKDWLAKIERDKKSRPTLERAKRMAKFASSLDLRSIRDIRPIEIIDLLRPIESSGRLETAGRLRAAISSIFKFAVASGQAEHDPAGLLRGVISAPKPTHRAAIIDRKAFGGLLRAIDVYSSRQTRVREALQLLALTAARPGELRLAEWGEFDLDAAVWTVPPGRMKMRQPHRVPLSRQSVDILRDLQKEGEGTLVFRSPRPGRPLSENAFNAALRTMGFGKEDVSAHGFRSTFSTMANESGLWAYDAIERALAHQDSSEVRRAYHRADYFEERRRLMQWWADQIDEMRAAPAS